MRLDPRFVVDQQGQQTAVLLPVEQYNALLEALEDRLDSQDLEQAISDDADFESYEQLRSRLRAEGKI